MLEVVKDKNGNLCRYYDYEQLATRLREVLEENERLSIIHKMLVDYFEMEKTVELGGNDGADVFEAGEIFREIRRVVTEGGHDDH